MRQFVTKIQFQAENITASRMLSLIAEAVENTFPDTDFRFAIIPDQGITESDWDADEAFDDAITQVMNAGLNDNPMPEGMPKL